MRQLIVFIFLIVLTGKAMAGDREEVLGLLDVQIRAWNKGDIPAFMETYWKSDSLLFVGKNGPAYGWQNTMDNYRRNYDSREKMGTLSFEILQAKPMASDVYFVLGKWNLVRNSGNIGGYYTLLFKKFPEGWKIIADHSS